MFVWPLLLFVLFIIAPVVPEFGGGEERGVGIKASQGSLTTGRPTTPAVHVTGALKAAGCR